MVHFDSDHMSGAVPEIPERLEGTNHQHFTGYGEDQICKAAKKNTCLEMIDRNGYWWTLYMSLLHYFRNDNT